MKKLRFLILMPLLFFTTCTIFGPFENVIIDEIYNKKESKKAILFIKQGNATVDNSFQIIVERYDYEIEKSDTGNVFIADSDHSSVSIDSSSATSKWISNDTLIITYDHRLRIFKKDSLIDGVKIIYKQK